MFKRIRAAWRALFHTATALTPLPEQPEEVARRRGISDATIWEANRRSVPLFLPERTFAPAIPAPGVIPGNGMAMDSVPDNFNALVAYATDQIAHEGLGFLGYPYLAELSQRAEYQKIASIWAEHCTRKWIKLTGDDERVKLLEQELDRLDVRAIFRAAIEKECQFGRCQVFMDFGDHANPAELVSALVVDERKISAKRPLKRLSVVEPMWSYPAQYEATNPLAPDFYKPSEWYVSGARVHASRLMTLVGHDVPDMLKPAYAFGGVALNQMCKPYVDNWLRARQSGSDLLHAFSVMVLATDMEQVMSGVIGAEGNLFKRVDLFNKTRDNRGTFLIDKNSEDFTNVSAPIAGLDKLIAQAQEQMSSVSGIPLTILLGITPSGLNASSEGEFRSFYDAILAYLEKVAGPHLRTLLDVVQLSLFGDIDQEIGFEFKSLWEMSDADKAAIRKSDAEADVAYIGAGVIDADEARDRLRNDETSLYHGVDLTGPAPDVPEDDEEDETAFRALTQAA